MDFLKIVFEFVAQGGSAAVIAILFAVVVLLIWDRIKLTRSLTSTTQLVYDAKDKETKSIREIIDKYYQGNLDLVNALNEIKMVLITIQSSQKR